MKANLPITEVVVEGQKKGGLFSGRQPSQTMWQFRPNVEFNDEEKAALTKYGYWDHPIYTYKETEKYLSTLKPEIAEYSRDNDIIFTVKDLAMNKVLIRCNDPVAANMVVDEFAEKILPLIKNYITASASPGARSCWPWRDRTTSPGAAAGWARSPGSGRTSRRRARRACSSLSSWPKGRGC